MIRLDEDVEDDNDDDNDDDKKYEEGMTLPHLTESRRRRFWYKKRRTKRSNDEDKLILTLPIFLFSLVRNFLRLIEDLSWNKDLYQNDWNAESRFS